MGLDEPDDHVLPVLAAAPALVQHRERLPDARRGAEVDPERTSRHGNSLPLSAVGVEREVQLEHVDAGLAEESEGAPVRVLVDEREHVVERECRVRARHAGPGERALAVEMCGSRPEPEAVTASTGTFSSAERPFSER